MNVQLILLISALLGLGTLTFLADRLISKPVRRPILIETRQIIIRRKNSQL